MELPVETTVPRALPPVRGRSVVGEWTIALTIICSVVLAAGGGYVFYASIRPVSIAEGYGAVMFDFPWMLAFLVLAAAWVGGLMILLVLGLIHLVRHACRRWWSAACWLILLAVDAAPGFLILHGYRLLSFAYPTDTSGEAIGPSVWAPSGPHWLALVAAAGELAVGTILIAFVNASVGKVPAGFRLAFGRISR